MAVSAGSYGSDIGIYVRGSCTWGADPREKVGFQLVRILVVDDNPTVRHYLRAILEQQCAWCVSEARTGEEALCRVQDSPPDVVVLDFRMPDLNGLEVAREIGRQRPGIPILMVTVHLSDQLKAEAKAAGILGFCAKSDIGSLVEAVDAVLRHESYFRAPVSEDGIGSEP